MFFTFLFVLYITDLHGDENVLLGVENGDDVILELEKTSIVIQFTLAAMYIVKFEVVMLDAGDNVLAGPYTVSFITVFLILYKCLLCFVYL